MSDPRPKTPSQRAFFLRKLHSLSGVVPLGAFVAEHLWTNAAILGGQRPFDEAVGKIQQLNLLPFIEVFGIFLPLAYHALYGVVIALQSKPNVASYNYSRNWLYALQRITGVIVLAFVCLHLWEFRVQKWLFGMSAGAFYPTLVAHLSWTWWGVPWIAFGYLIGVGSTLFHLANGLVGFCMSWGIATSQPALKRVGVVAGTACAGLFVLAACTVVDLATGTQFLAHEPPPGADCAPSN